MNMKISTKRHCIETEIKRQYNRAISAYFKAGDENEKKDLENRIELLQHALETFDFNALRNQHADLRGDSDADVRLGANASGQLHITINGEEIETTDSN
mgnify:CR=1 FL=1